MNKKLKLLLGMLILVLLTTVACSKEENPAEVPAEEENQELEEGEEGVEGVEGEEGTSLPSHEEFVSEVDGKGVTKEEFEQYYLYRKYAYIMSYGEEVFEGEEADELEENLRLELQGEIAKEQIFILLAENAGFKKDLEEAATIYKEEFLVTNTEETLKYFEENGLDEEYMLNRIATSQLVGEFVEKLTKDYEASDGFIEAQKSLNLVRASHILLETEEEASETKDLIEEEPSRFEMLAAEKSTCPSAENEGDLGYFELGAMVAEFSDAAFAMEVGEISDIVESEFGYHIIKVTDKGTLFELAENDLEEPSLEETKQRLIEAAVWEEFYTLYEEQVEKTPIQYYSLED